VVGVGAGVAGGVLGDLTGGQAEDATTAGDAAESGDSAGDSGGDSSEDSDRDSAGGSEDPEPAEEGSADQVAPESADEAPPNLTAARGVPEVGSDRALRRVVRATAARDLAAYGELDALRDRRSKQGRTQAACVAPEDAEGSTVAVTYRGEDATLVVRRDGDLLEGRVYDCTLGLLLDGVRLPTSAE
jgi:hypothetical protein